MSLMRYTGFDISSALKFCPSLTVIGITSAKYANPIFLQFKSTDQFPPLNHEIPHWRKLVWVGKLCSRVFTINPISVQ